MGRLQQVTPQRVEEALAAVYARPEFAGRTLPAWLEAIYDLIDRVRTAIRELFISLLEVAFRTGGFPLLSTLIIAVAALAFLWLLFHVGSDLVQTWRAKARSRVPAEAGPPAAPDRDAAYWEAEAARAAAAGRIRDAAFAFYHALVLRLEERGAVRYDPAKTPGDYRREATRHAEAAPVLNGFLEIFEPLAWGRRGEDMSTLERLRAVAAQAGVRG